MDEPAYTDLHWVSNFQCCVPYLHLLLIEFETVVISLFFFLTNVYANLLQSTQQDSKTGKLQAMGRSSLKLQLPNPPLCAECCEVEFD